MQHATSRLPLDYLIDAIVELRTGLGHRIDAIDAREGDYHDEVRRERDEWQAHIQRLETVALTMLDNELATLSEVPGHHLPTPDELLRTLTGAARCRRKHPGSPADSIFTS